MWSSGEGTAGELRGRKNGVTTAEGTGTLERSATTTDDAGLSGRPAGRCA